MTNYKQNLSKFFFQLSTNILNLRNKLYQLHKYTTGQKIFKDKKNLFLSIKDIVTDLYIDNFSDFPKLNGKSDEHTDTDNEVSLIV